MPAPTVFVPTLRKKERLRLQKAARSAKNPKLRDRCRAMLWSGEGKTTGEIARLLGLAATTPMRWIKDYRRFGFAGLIPEKIPGRPRAVDDEGEAVLQAALRQNPRDLGYLFTRWTTATLAEHLYSATHTRVSHASVRRALKRLRYRYKRPKLSLKHKQDPQDVRRAKRERDAALKKSRPIPTVTPCSSKTNANSISIPA
jgi:putative transposase